MEPTVKTSMLIRSALLAVTSLGLPPCVIAGEIHVDQAHLGDSTGSAEEPFTTINAALVIALPGDVVLVHPGTYIEQLILETDDLTLRGEPGAVLSGMGLSLPYEGLVWLESVTGVAVLDLTIEDSPTFGISGWNCSDIEVSGCTIRRSDDSGIYVCCSADVRIDGNEIDSANQSADGVKQHENLSIAESSRVVVSDNFVHDSAVLVALIDVKQGCSDVEVRGNRLENTGAMEGFCQAIYVDAHEIDQDDIRIVDNVATGCLVGLLLTCELGANLTNVLVQGNVFHGNSRHGIWLPDDWGAAAAKPISGVRILNNTLYGNGWWDTYGAGIALQNPDLSDCLIQNNICLQNTGPQLFHQYGTAVTTSGNCTFPYPNTFGPWSADIEGDIVADPLLVDAAGGDFHLRPDSPCLDTGVPLPAGLDVDLDSDGDPRVLDGDLSGSLAVDVGADEYAPIRLELSYVSTPVETLVGLDVIGWPGLSCWLLLGPPAELSFPGIGEVLVDPLAGAIVPWFATPSSVSLSVAISGLEGMVLQALVVDTSTGAAAVSNPEVLGGGS